MNTEFEAKFYPVNKDNYREKLEEVGATLVEPERTMRRVLFDHRVNPNMKCDYIRVRDEGNEIRLSAKIHAKQDGELSDQKEQDVTVNDFDAAVDILKTAGLVASHYQETLRETWEFEDAEVTIDTWPGLDPYSEIEAESEEKVHQIANKLGLNWESRRITSVTEIFMEVYNLNESDTLDKIANITFENNPFNK